MNDYSTPTCPGCKKPLVIRADRLAKLPATKRQIAKMLAEGMRQVDIAKALGKTNHCIRVHANQIREECLVGDTRELTLYLYGLIEAGEER